MVEVRVVRAMEEVVGREGRADRHGVRGEVYRVEDVHAGYGGSLARRCVTHARCRRRTGVQRVVNGVQTSRESIERPLPAVLEGKIICTTCEEDMCGQRSAASIAHDRHWRVGHGGLVWILRVRGGVRRP